MNYRYYFGGSLLNYSIMDPKNIITALKVTPVGLEPDLKAQRSEAQDVICLITGAQSGYRLRICLLAATCK